MAVILQKVVGAPHGNRYYPHFSGVARSYNFYPAARQESGDGIASVALGMGRTVVEGQACLSFSPRHPQHVLSFSSVEDVVANSQREFWALELDDRSGRAEPEEAMRERRFGLTIAEKDGTLRPLGSTYSAENHAVYDGLAREGVRLVTFAPILKRGMFPLADTLAVLLDIGRRGMNREAEIEFAVRLAETDDGVHEFGFLQMRPLLLSRATDGPSLTEIDDAGLVCRSPQVLGNGVLADFYDLVVVDRSRFDRAHSREAAQEVARLNALLLAEQRPFILIGVGRWGSMDPWLGIPVTWDQIAGARVIVETGFRDRSVTPSQGSHFFQNITSFQIGYFTVNQDDDAGFVDWDWLAAQDAVADLTYVRHLRFREPLLVKMAGKDGQGVIYKPGAEA